MAPHPRSWLRSSLTVWLGYFLTGVAAVPASAFGLFLIGRGVGQEPAIAISISLAVLGGFIGEQLIGLPSRKQRRLAVSASPDIEYQPSWVPPPGTAAAFIEVLNQAAMAGQPFAHNTAFGEDAVNATFTPLAYRGTLSSMFVVIEEKNIVKVKDRKQPPKRTNIEPMLRDDPKDQVNRAAALSSYLDKATALADWA